jgi:hypothetical protein
MKEIKLKQRIQLFAIINSERTESETKSIQKKEGLGVKRRRFLKFNKPENYCSYGFQIIYDN